MKPDKAAESKVCAGRFCNRVIYRTNPKTGEVYSDQRWNALTYCSAECFNGLRIREYKKNTPGA